MSYSCWNCHAQFEDFPESCPACGMRLAADTGAIRKDGEAGAFSRFLHYLILLMGLAVLALALGYLYMSGDHKTAFATLSREFERYRREQAAETSRPKAERGRPAPDRPAKDWRVRGKVYDLVTLKPVSGAHLRWVSKANGSKYETMTSASGGYKTSLPKIADGGYALSISHKRYGSVYFDDVSPPYSTWDRDRRKEETSTLLSLTVVNLPVLPPMKTDDVELDYVMIKK